MDNNKDIQTDNGRGVTSATSTKKLDHISFFEKDEYFIFVYKKTEKLTTAVYMVTNLFSDSEPMKWALRGKVSDMLSFVLGYKNILPVQHVDFLHTLKTRVLSIVSLLEVASKSGLVSRMNFSILQEEFFNLITILDESGSKNETSKETALPSTFFDVPTSGRERADFSQNSPASSIDQGGIKDISKPFDTSFKKTNRQTIILGLLKKKKELSIRDIAQTIRDCSEKTIQRELALLTVKGLIRKEGEKRWSRYQLRIGN
jgi:hypothetical protein